MKVRLLISSNSIWKKVWEFIRNRKREYSKSQGQAVGVASRGPAQHQLFFFAIHFISMPETQKLKPPWSASNGTMRSLLESVSQATYSNLIDRLRNGVGLERHAVKNCVMLSYEEKKEPRVCCQPLAETSLQITRQRTTPAYHHNRPQMNLLCVAGLLLLTWVFPEIH